MIELTINENRLSYEQLLAENAALREENRKLKFRLGLYTQEMEQDNELYQIELCQTEPYQSDELSITDETPAVFAPNTVNTTVWKKSDANAKIELFMSLFRGRVDVYAKRWHSDKTGKSGYSPVCANEWNPMLCDKRAHKCGVCPNRSFARLDMDAIYQHLSGTSQTASDVVGLYPMTADECCYFLAIDFDDEDWQKDVSAFRAACLDVGFNAAVERSRSGNGGHVWFFFEDKLSATTARKFGSALLTNAMNRRHEIKFKSYDRLFPNQDTMPSGGFGNLIALPLQGKARKNGNSMFVDENFTPYGDQWAYLSSVPKLTLDQVETCIKKLTGDFELGMLTSIGSEESQKPWEAEKQAQELTPFDFTGAVQIVKANMLHILKNGISQNALNRIKRLGAFKNPDFYKAQAMRLPTYNKPRIIDCTDENDEYLSIPRGCEDDLTKLIECAGSAYKIEDKRNSGTPIKAEFNGVLRPEQQEAAAELLKYETGVLSATTAFGKTVIGSYIISERKTNTLILVHTSALLSQWKKSLSQFLKIEHEVAMERQNKRGRKKEPSVIGQLGGAHNDLHGVIDVAIMQSVVSGGDVKDFVTDYGLVIVDECHHVSAVSFEKILKTVNAKYVYGLTATPIRQDGQQPVIFMQCGNIRYRADAKAQAAQTGIERFVAPRFTSFKKPVSIDEKDFTITKVYAEISVNVARNKMIVSDVAEALKKGRISIVLTQRSAHVTLLANDLDAYCANVIRLTGSASAKEKREALERLKSVPQGEQFVIVATGKYVGEGFDEPRLDTLFLAAPISWKGTLQQYAGRLHRVFEGKKNVIVYDYVDVHVKMLENMYHKRVSGYSSMGYKALCEDSSESAGKIGVIFDNRSFLPVFENDVHAAKQEILIVSPFIRKNRAVQMMRHLLPVQIGGTKVVILTRSADSYKLTDQPTIIELMSELSGAGVKVIEKPNIHQKFAVIDRNVVWYGSINFLSYGFAEESVMRFENPEIAGELLDSIE